MSRPQGSRNALIRVTYDVIAELASGITGNTARAYARRGEYDARNLESILRWVNSRRQRQGLPLVGMPDAEVVCDDTPTPIEARPPYDPWSLFLSGAEVYIPTIAEYRKLDDFKSS